MKPDCLPRGFLHQLCVHSVGQKKAKSPFANTNIATVLKLAPRAPDFHVLAPETIF